MEKMCEMLFIVTMVLFSEIALSQIPDEMPFHIKEILTIDYHAQTNDTLNDNINEADSIADSVAGAVNEFAPEISFYVRDLGITEEEAAKRILSRDKWQDVSAELEEYLEYRLAGVWVQNTPEYKLIYWLKGDDPVPDWVNSIVIEDVMAFEVRTGANYTRKEIGEQRGKLRPFFEKMLPDLIGVSLDQKNNGITLDFGSTESKEFLENKVTRSLQEYEFEGDGHPSDMPFEINVYDI